MTDGTVANVSSARVQAFHQRMLERANLTDNDRGEEVMLQQADRIFAAAETDDLDKILNADMGGTIQMRDVPGTVWEIRGFNPVTSNRTDLENTAGYYVSCDATYLGGPPDVARSQGLIMGESYALQTGADLAVFKLAALDAAELLPARVSVIGIKTSAGRQVVKLGPPPENMVTGEVS